MTKMSKNKDKYKISPLFYFGRIGGPSPIKDQYGLLLTVPRPYRWMLDGNGEMKFQSDGCEPMEKNQPWPKKQIEDE
jgi:hypothetical protein